MARNQTPLSSGRPGELAQAAASLLAQGSGRLQMMIVQQRLSRSVVDQVASWVDQARQVLRRIQDDDDARKSSAEGENP